MRQPRRRIYISAILLGIFFLLGPYQNCAIHQSEGRKQFEQLLSRSVVTESGGCDPFLFTNTAGAIMDDLSTTARIVQSGSDQQCVVSTSHPPAGFDQDTGLETAVCLLTPNTAFQGIEASSDTATPSSITSRVGAAPLNNKVYYFTSSGVQEKEATQPPQAAPAGEEHFFGFALDGTTTVKYQLVNSARGLNCFFVLDKTLYGSNTAIRELATQRASQLVHEIDQNY